MTAPARPVGALDFGAIVVGGGHNGLICAAYLARAGVKTVVLEARGDVGGCASTVSELGARFNICNCDHRVFRTTPIADELGLAEHGLRYLDVDPGQLSMSYDGTPAWPLFHDVERTLEGLRLTHPHEVDGYRGYLAAARPVADLLLDIAGGLPTPGRVARRVGLRWQSWAAATMLRWSRLSVADVLRQFFRSDALLGPAVVVGPAVWGLSPETPRTGLGALGYAMEHVAQVGRPVGGSGALPQAVRAAFEAAGGTVYTSARVSSILCEGPRVRGVALADGTVIEAPIVVSACDPHATFVDWLADPPANATGLVDRWRARSRHEGYESKLDAVVGELPRYRSVDQRLADRLGFDPSHPTMIVAPGLAEMHRAHQAMQHGQIAHHPMLFANVPSVLDPTMITDDGAHVFSLEVLYTPYSFHGGWATDTEPRRWLDRYAELVQPEWLSSIRRFRTMTPVAYEHDFNMPRGYATSFSGGPLAALLGRDRELTRYETPVQGLYLTGAATFPGAGVWGASGRNAAHVVLGRS